MAASYESVNFRHRRGLFFRKEKQVKESYYYLFSAWHPNIRNVKASFYNPQKLKDLWKNLYLFYLKIVNLAQTAREQSCDY